MSGTVTTKRILYQGCRLCEIMMRVMCHVIRNRRPKQGGEQENSAQEVYEPEHADTIAPSNTIHVDHKGVRMGFA